MQSAAMQAYREGIPLNLINPVSLAAIGVIHFSMDEKLIDGYAGSRPDLLEKEDEICNILKEIVIRFQDIHSNTGDFKEDIIRLEKLKSSYSKKIVERFKLDEIIKKLQSIDFESRSLYSNTESIFHDVMNEQKCIAY